MDIPLLYLKVKGAYPPILTSFQTAFTTLLSKDHSLHFIKNYESAYLLYRLLRNIISHLF